MPSLYTLTLELRELEDALVDSGGEITPEIEEQYGELLHNMDEKSENYAAFIVNKKAEAQALKDEIARLTAKKRAAEKTVASLLSRMQGSMRFRGITKIQTKLGNFSLRAQGKGKTVLKAGVNVDRLLKRFRRTKHEPDLTAIRAALDSGESAAQKIAEVIPPTESLYFK